MTQKRTTRDETTAKQRTCLAQALRLLGRRALTAQALAAQLAIDGYPDDSISQAMAQITTWGYINDERLGESVVAAAVRQKKGPAWLRQQLSRRQVPPNIAHRCIESLADDALILACDLLERRFDAEKLADPRTAQRAMRLLQRRGFDGSTCVSAVRRMAARGSPRGANSVASMRVDTDDDPQAL